MSTTYTYSKSVNDTTLLFSYLTSNFAFSTLQSLVCSGTTVALTFPSPLSAANQTLLSTLVRAYQNPAELHCTAGAGLLTFNSTTSLLPAGGSFSGNWEDVAEYTAVRLSFTASAASATDGILVQFGVTAPQADLTKKYTLSLTSTAYAQIHAVVGRYFRVLFTNGPVAQTAFSLSTMWATGATMRPDLSLSDDVLSTASCVLTKALMNGRRYDGRHTTQRLDGMQQLRVYTAGQYRRVSCMSSTPVIQHSFTYAVNTDLANITLTGSGSVTYAAGCAVITNGTTASSNAILASDKYVRCAPGNVITFIVSAAFSAGVAGVTQIAGAGTTENGVYWGFNGTQFGVGYRSNSGTLQFTTQSSLSGDKLDGTGPSGIVLNPLLASQYMIVHDPSGYGTVSYYLLAPALSSLPEPVLVHEVKLGGSTTDIGILNPQFPCTAAVYGSAAANAAATVRVSDMAAYLDGDARLTRVVRSAEGTQSLSSSLFAANVARPVLLIQNRSTFNGVTNTSSLVLRHVAISCSDSTTNVTMTIYRNATVSNLVYTNVNQSNSIVAYSSNGNMAYTDGSGIDVFNTAVVSQNIAIDLTQYDLSISPGETLCATCLQNAKVTISASVTLSWAEFQ